MGLCPHAAYAFRDACYALRLLDDDREYIDVIIEANSWSSATFVHSMFASLLIHVTITSPAHVWVTTWIHLSDDILLKQRHITRNPG